MNTYNEIIFMILDQLKANSDDTFWNRNHIVFLMHNVRKTLLENRYSALKRNVPLSTYQTICLNLKSTEDCDKGSSVLSIENVPQVLNLGDNIIRYNIYPINDDIFNSITWTLVDRERIRYVGDNEWLKQIIYFAIDHNNKLVLKSRNPNFKYLRKIKMVGVFEDPLAARDLLCDNNGESIKCDKYDIPFPLDGSLIDVLVDTVVSKLLPKIGIIEDNDNNAKDDLPELNR